jgi:hypothetical protein
LKALASAHYEGKHNPPRKAFDYYVATALVYFLLHEEEVKKSPPAGMMAERNIRRLFFCEEYGLTFVSVDHTWDATLERYISNVNTVVEPSDDPFTRTKKEYFSKEIHIMRTIPLLPSLKAIPLSFLPAQALHTYLNFFFDNFKSSGKKKVYQILALETYVFPFHRCMILTSLLIQRRKNLIWTSRSVCVPAVHRAHVRNDLHR